ncbi:MAG: DNA cytosine methyltransferase, partial [Terriglobales bacterium]
MALLNIQAMETATGSLSQPTIDPCLEPVPFTVSEELTSIEFFAGIGLTHLGLSSHGWKCVYANDIDAKKWQMYQDRFGETSFYHLEDVW